MFVLIFTGMARIGHIFNQNACNFVFQGVIITVVVISHKKLFLFHC